MALARQPLAPPRRPKGSGTIYQRRADGLWVAEVTINGTRVRATGRTSKLAEARRDRRVKGISVPGLGPDPTVTAWLRHWVANADGLRDRTRNGYRVIIERHLIPALGHMRLRELTPLDTKTMLDELAATGMSPGTRRNVRNCLSGALQAAFEINLIPTNAARVKVSKPVSRAAQIRVSIKEAQRLLDVILGHQYRDLWALTLYTGGRVGEMVALDWADVRLADRVIYCRQAWTRVDDGDGGTTNGWGLPKSGPRDIPLASEAVDLLWSRYHRMGDPKSGLVFPSQRDPNKPVSPSHTLAALKKVMIEAEMTPVRQHDLRHWCASILLGRGVPVETVSKILGHRNAAITRAIYAHVISELEHEHVEKLEFFPNRPRAVARRKREAERAAQAAT
jgi:integrase